jgi:hypothetical protein
MKEPIHISVRPLVEYVHRSGSIHGGFRSNSSMLEGTRVHQLIQKSYKEHDRKEVHLRAEIPYDDNLFIVEGRCDGLIELDGIWTVDEIKSVSVSLEDIQGEGQPVHWAQAVLYAYMIAREEQRDSMQAQLTYVQVHSGETRRFRRELSFAELEAFAQVKVLQAGGRLIRTEHDEGLLVLVDDRFAKEPYASLLPEEWRRYRLTEQARSGKEWTGHEF